MIENNMWAAWGYGKSKQVEFQDKGGQKEEDKEEDNNLSLY